MQIHATSCSRKSLHILANRSKKRWHGFQGRRLPITIKIKSGKNGWRLVKDKETHPDEASEFPSFQGAGRVDRS